MRHYTRLLTGPYTVSFSSLPNWTSPASVPVTIGRNGKTTIHATYLAVTNQLQIAMAGLGKISPNYSNAWLQVGNSYSITSSPANGFNFTNWTISTNWPAGIVTNNKVLHFTMATNLALLVTMVETSRPSLTIIAPRNKQHLSSTVASLEGTASDNWGLAGVWYQLNGGGWKQPATTNHWVNWAATLPLVASTNTIQAFAQNLGGNYSATSSVYVVCGSSFDIQMQMHMEASPRGNGGFAFTLQLPRNLNGHVEYSTNLVNWVRWTDFAGTNNTIRFIDPATTNCPKRFYRAVTP